jgi:serine/threonine-protein kinase
VEIVAGKTARVPVALPKGIAHLNATPWAEVWVDGAKVGDTPIGNLQLTVGPHEIVFKHPELGERSHAATVKVGEPLRLSVDLNEQR